MSGHQSRFWSKAHPSCHTQCSCWLSPWLLLLADVRLLQGLELGSAVRGEAFTASVCLCVAKDAARSPGQDAATGQA